MATVISNLLGEKFRDEMLGDLLTSEALALIEEYFKTELGLINDRYKFDSGLAEVTGDTTFLISSVMAIHIAVLQAKRRRDLFISAISIGQQRPGVHAVAKD